MSFVLTTTLLLAAVAAQGGPRTQLPPSTPEGRRAVEAIGRCVAEHSPGPAAAMLNRDFTSRAYISEFDQLLRRNSSCLDQVEHMASSRLLIAGAIAEALVERETDPVNVTLARAAMRPAPPARGPSDRIAICTVRSAPDEVGTLFATEAASDSETAATRALQPVVTLCNSSGPPLEITPAGMRAILATAAFRNVRGGEATIEARN